MIGLSHSNDEKSEKRATMEDKYVRLTAGNGSDKEMTC
jgi:hypothetical protein